MRPFLLITSFLFISLYAKCAWININSGINDELTSISFSSIAGLITGKKGVYITTNGGTATGSWIRVHSYFSLADSISYNRSQFSGSINATYPGSNKFFFCGEDTVMNVAVIFEYNHSTGKIKCLYTGIPNSSLNDICQDLSHVAYAVGNNGLIISFDQEFPVFNVLTTNFNYELNSVSYHYSNNLLVMGAGDYIIQAFLSPFAPTTFVQTYYPQRNFRDVLATSSTSYYAVGKNYFRADATGISEPHMYYSDSLNANSVMVSSARVFVGTGTGIYSSYNNTDILELQPATSGYYILDVNSNWSTLFACGKNGVILYTDDMGGNPEPYAQIDFNGSCLNTSQVITSTKGTVLSCTNYIDNILINSSCSGFNYTFTTIGTYELKLVVSNGSYSKTIIKTISINSPPQIDLLTAIADTILCKQETLDITLSNTENDIYYSLHKIGDTLNYGNSSNSTGGILNFQTDILNQSGIYYIRANSSTATCFNDFTNQIAIEVEKPVSRIHFDIINAEVNEDVRFYQKALNATNFEWQFTNNPALSNSTSPNLVNSFAGIGSSVITLIAGTDNNCYDTMSVRGPFIYQPFATDTSWLLLNSRFSSYNNSTTYGEDIIKTIKSRSGGYVVIGNYLHRQVNSRVGDSVSLPGLGQYVAKYDDFGILKWCIKTKTINQSNFGYDVVTDIIEDSQGNLFITANNPSSGLIDNKGDTLLANCSFLLKTDSLGRTIWSRSMHLNQGSFLNVNHDYNDDVYVTIAFVPSSVYIPVAQNALLLNGSLDDTISLSESLNFEVLDMYKIVKFSNDGVKLSDFMFEEFATNLHTSPQVVFDSLNNMYLWGSHEGDGVIHELTTGDTVRLVNLFGNYGGKMFITKFDTNGNYLWKVQGYTRQNSFSDRTEIHELIADASGNLYATGQNNFTVDIPHFPQTIINSDNSQSLFYGGQYFLVKISPDGMTQWLSGNVSSYAGTGLDILLDGDTLYTVGATQNISSGIYHEFLGENNQAVSVIPSPGNYFVNKYALNGDILAVYLNGPANLVNGLYMSSKSYPNLIKLDDGYFLLNKSFSSFNSVNQSLDFGFPILYTGFPQDGTQLKIKLNQGIEFSPHYLIHNYDSICYNEYYTLPNGVQLGNLTATTIYEDTLATINGMDSINRFHIFVYPLNQTNISVNACKGEDVDLPNGTIVSNIQHDSIVEFTLQNMQGCDSTVTINISVTIVNQVVVRIGNQLIAQDPSATYQWVNCSTNFSIIPGQTGITFTPSVNGNYAAIVTKNGCGDTSACYLFADLGIDELDNQISISPNPTKSSTLIKFGKFIDSANISVYSNDGREILQSSVIGIEKFELDLTPFEKGTYFVRIASDNGNSEFIIVRN